MPTLTTFADPPATPEGATPVVVAGDDGRYIISWPQGRPERFVISSGLFEQMVADINQGRQLVDVLKGVADALGRVVPSASTQSGTP